MNTNEEITMNSLFKNFTTIKKIGLLLFLALLVVYLVLSIKFILS